MDQVTDFWSSLELGFQAFTEGLNGVLFAMAKEPSDSQVGFLFANLIDALQMMAFALPKAATMSMNFPSSVSWLANLFSFLKFGNLAIELIGVVPAISVVLTLVSLQLANLLYVGNAWAKKEFHVLWPIKVLRYTMKTFVGILYIPIVTVLSTVFNCSGFTSTTQCNILFPFVLVVLVAFVGIGLVANVTLFDPRPTSSSPAARPHSRIHVLQLVAKTLLSILFPVISLHPNQNTVAVMWSASVMLMFVPLAFLFTWYQPYFHTKSTLIKAVLANIQAWLAISAFVHVQFLYDPENSEQSGILTTSMIFVGLLIVIPVAWFAVYYRWYLLSVMPFNKCSNVFELELRTRFELQSKNPYSGDIQERAEIVHSWYMQMAKLFPLSSALHAFHAHMILDYLPNRPSLVRRSILLAEHVGLGVDFAFIVFKTKRTLEEETGSYNVLRLVKSDFLLQEAIGFDKQCSIELVEFWGELSQKKPNLEKIRSLTQTIASSSALARQRYNELLQLNPDSTSTLKLLGSFLMDVVNDTQTANRLLKKAAHMENQVSVDVEERLNKVSSDSVGVLLVRGGTVPSSTGTEHLNSHSVVGEIIKANAQAGRLMNEISSSLIGKRVQSFLIPPLSSSFQEIMKEFLKNGKDHIFETLHRTFLRTKDNALLPVNIRFKPHIGEDSEFLVYIIFAEVEKNSDSRGNFSLLTDSGEFVGGSQEFLATFFMQIEKQEKRGHLEEFGHKLEFSKIIKIFPFLLKRFKMEGILNTPVLFDESTGQLFLQGEEFSSQKQLPVAILSMEPYIFLEAKLIQVFLALPTQEGSTIDDENDGQYSEGESSTVPLLFRNHTETGVRFQEDESTTNKIPNKSAGKISRIASKTSSVESVDRLRKKAIEIRRMLVQNSKSQMDPTLKYLRKIYSRATLIMMILSVAQFTYCNKLLTKFEVDVEFIGQIGFRRTLALSIAVAAHTLILVKQGILPIENEHRAKDTLKSASISLKDIDSEMFFLRTSVNQEMVDLYEKPLISYSFLNGKHMEPQNMTLYDSVLRFSSLAYQAGAQNTSSFSYEDPSTFSLIANAVQITADENNGIMNMLAGLEYSTDIYTLHIRDSLNKVLVTFEAISTGLCIFTTVSLIIAIRPLIGNGGKIESTKREVLEVFEGIPKRVAREVAERFINRLADVHNETMDFPELEANKPDESTSKVPAKASRKSARAHNEKGLKKKRKLSCMSRQKLIIIFKMASLLFASFVYFFSIIVLISNTNSALRGAPSTANHAGFRRTRSLLVSHEIRLFLTKAFQDSEVGAQLNAINSPLLANVESIRKRANELLETHHKIMYGSPSENMKGVFHEIESVHDPYFLNLLDVYSAHGCSHWPTDKNISQEECEVFLNGILSHGLHNGLIEFTNLVKDLSYSTGLIQSMSIRDAVFSQPVQEVLSMEELLQIQLNTIIELHAALTISIVEREKFIMLFVTLLYLSVCLVSYFLVVRRLLFRLDLEVKRTRALLLVIPEDLFYSSGEIQKFLLNQFGVFSSSASVKSDISSKGSVAPL